MAQHTPGPWTADTTHHKVARIVASGTAVAMCSIENARLIAAAPTMLAILRRIAAQNDRDLDGDGRNYLIHGATMDAVIDAIAKAEGTDGA